MRTTHLPALQHLSLLGTRQPPASITRNIITPPACAAYVIYLLTNKLNGKGYIGQTCNFEERLAQHGNGHGCNALAADLREANATFADNITHTILRTDVPHHAVNAVKAEEIAKHGTRKPAGYNDLPGAPADYMPIIAARQAGAAARATRNNKK